MIEVRLTWIEGQIASMVGSQRQIEALAKGLPNRHGAKAEVAWNLHIEGAAGEMAAARALNLYWGAPVGTFKRGGDVGDIQVRTAQDHSYGLIVRNGDRDTDIFVLVTGTVPLFHVHGWMEGKEAKHPKWSRNYGGRPAAFFVPQRHLRDIEELRAIVARRSGVALAPEVRNSSIVTR